MFNSIHGKTYPLSPTVTHSLAEHSTRLDKTPHLHLLLTLNKHKQQILAKNDNFLLSLHAGCLLFQMKMNLHLCVTSLLFLVSSDCCCAQHDVIHYLSAHTCITSWSSLPWSENISALLVLTTITRVIEGVACRPPANNPTWLYQT